MRGFQINDSNMLNKDIILPKMIDKNKYNVFSPKNIVIPAKRSVKIDTGIKFVFTNYETLKFVNKSDIYVDHKIIPKQQYLNEHDAILTLVNTSDKEFCINKGDIICDAVFERVWLLYNPITD